MPDEDNTDAPAPKADDGKTFTQTDLDKLVEDRLARERKKFADYEDLKAKAAKFEQLDAANKSDIDKATEKATAAEARAAKAESDALRLRVAFDKGLSPSQAKRLAGATQEELEADADELIEAFPTKSGAAVTAPPTQRPRPNLQGGSEPTSEAVETDPAKLAAAVPRL